jgi:hypothetical protein
MIAFMEATKKIYFLNEKVEQELRANHNLLVIWVLQYGSYDDEIEPLHNPDWVRTQKEVEAQKLTTLKDRLVQIGKELGL